MDTQQLQQHGLKIPVVIIRHPKERLSKCSLEPLREREELTFLKARKGLQFDATGNTLLALKAPELTPEDASRPLLLLDSTWRLLPEVEACVFGEPVKRSLPNGVVTSYPRVSRLTMDPLGGLASVEALYWAKRIMGEEDVSLLHDYYWRDNFLKKIATWEKIIKRFSPFADADCSAF